MTTVRNQWDELDDLLARLCENTLTPNQAWRLECLVEGNREARQRYLSYLYLDGALRWEKAVGLSTAVEDPFDEEDPDSQGHASGKSPILGFLSNLLPPNENGLFGSHPTALFFYGIAIGAMLTLLFSLTFSPIPLPKEKPAAAPIQHVAQSVQNVAQLTGQVDCRWAEEPPRDGNLAAGERLELAEGFAELTFHDGARVVLHGPVVFRADSPSEGFLFQGKLSATVPRPAIGFAVRTPQVKVIDLSTEFGVVVDASGATEAHVFRGAVDLENLWSFVAASPDRSKRRRLEAGQAARVDSKGSPPSRIKLDVNRFARDLSPESIAATRQPRPEPVSSTFDRDLEGWTACGDGSKPIHLSDAGNPGGCIQVTDSGTMGFFYFVAPEKFLGNYQGMYGKHLSFDLLIRSFSSDAPKYGEPEEDIRITGAKKAIGIVLPFQPKPDQWTHYSVPLSTEGKWYRADLLDHPPADEQDILDVLNNVKELLIRGEFLVGKDLGHLDNVILGADK